MLINLIGENQHIGVVGEHVDQRLQFIAAIHATGGVARRAEEHYAGLFGESVAQLIGSDFEIGLYGRRHKHVLALRKIYHLHVAHPCRCGDDNLVAGVDH